MPLIEPGNSYLREKFLLCAPPKSGKSSCALSFAHWAYKTGDTRKFFIIDTEDAIEAVMNEEKYAGMKVSEGGYVEIFPVNDWEEYQAASEKALATCGERDFIVIDMITHAWKAVQNYYVQQVQKRTRAEALLDASKKGAKGWEVFKGADMDWTVINSLYEEFLKPILLGTRAHVFMLAEQEEIREGGNMPAATKDHLSNFGRFKAVGQKSLPYQCRSYLRLQRLARGRVLYTLGDRARRELNGEEMSDFFLSYGRGVANWSYTMPETSAT